MTVTLANAGAKDRSATDFYPTPPEVTGVLLSFLKLPLKGKDSPTIWEPACGAGHMVRVMEGRGYYVVPSDIHPMPEISYRPHYEIFQQRDFLTTDSTEGCNWIITNPPFSLAEEFIRHAYKLQPSGGFAFLLKSQYWHASRRLQLFRDIPPDYVLPLTWRPDFLFGSKSGSPTMEVLWTVWKAPYTNKQTIYTPLSKADRRALNN